MDLAAKLLDYINDNYESITSTINEASWIVNLKGIEDRERSIKNLLELKEKIDDLAAVIENRAQEAQKIHQTEINRINTFINRLKKNGDKNAQDEEASWTKVTTRRRNFIPRPEPPRVHQEIDHKAKIHFTSALFLQATKVPTFDQVESNGELFYVESSDHFAFKLAGVLFHGNIGSIYTDEKSPEKIKNCKFKRECIKRDRCDYYHDPLKFPGSKDTRNFIASSWLYAPPNSQFKNKSKSRRFGSKEHLDMDIVNLQEEEIDRFFDQSMHDILCSLLLRRYSDPNGNIRS